MGWAEPRGDGWYRAAWRDDRGRKHTRSGFAHKKRAERYAAEQEAKAARGEPTYVARSMTWSAWWAEWNDGLRPGRSRTDADSVAGRVRKYLEPRWGSVQLARITREDVQVWVNELAGLMAPASVEKVYYLFRSSITAAVGYGRLATSPCVLIELPEPAPPDERWLTPEEFTAALEYLGQPYRSMAIVLVGTGMRGGEACVLHEHRVDHARGVIRVREAWDGVEVQPYPKGRRLRDIPMVSWVAKGLLRVNAAQLTDCGLVHAESRQCRSGLAIPAPRGGQINMRNFYRRHWTPALQRAGVSHARVHDLRHTCASWLKQAGRPDAEIAAILGHSEQRTAFRYAHLGTDYLDHSRTALEQIGMVL